MMSIRKNKEPRVEPRGTPRFTIVILYYWSIIYKLQQLNVSRGNIFMLIHKYMLRDGWLLKFGNSDI